MLEDKVGEIMISIVCAIFSRKNARNVRFIHDVRLSCVNEMAIILERSVLPKLLGAAKSMLQMISECSAKEEVEIMAVDFPDAFKHLLVCSAEQLFPAG